MLYTNLTNLISFRSNLVEIPRGSAEYNRLSSEMKRECEGKQIFRSEITVSEEDNGFQENGFFIPVPDNRTEAEAEASFAVQQRRIVPVTTARPVTPGPCPNEQVLVGFKHVRSGLIDVRHSLFNCT